MTDVRMLMKLVAERDHEEHKMVIETEAVEYSDCNMVICLDDGMFDDSGLTKPAELAMRHILDLNKRGELASKRFKDGPHKPNQAYEQAAEQAINSMLDHLDDEEIEMLLKIVNRRVNDAD